MVKIFLKLISFFTILFLVGGCTSSEPAFSVIPQIEFVSISPSVIKEWEPFELTLKYRDGDGDLGSDSNSKPDTFDFILVDTRTPLPKGLKEDYSSGFLPNLTPKTKNPSIQGEIKMRLEGIGIVNQLYDKEDVIFKVTIVDRKKQKSNTVLTSPLTISK